MTDTTRSLIQKLEKLYMPDNIGVNPQSVVDHNMAIVQAIAIVRKFGEQPDESPVAMRYEWDGFGYKYIDNGSGSDWAIRHKDAEPLYERPVQKISSEEEAIRWTRRYYGNKAAEEIAAIYAVGCKALNNVEVEE